MLCPWVSHLQIWYKPHGCAITILLYVPKGIEKKDTRKRKKDDDHDDKSTPTKKTSRSPKKHIEVATYRLQSTYASSYMYIHLQW